MGVYYTDQSNVAENFWNILNGKQPPNLFEDFLSSFSEQYDTMSKPPHVMSISYGSPETAVTKSVISAWDTLAMKLALQGVTILVSSGDDGAAGVADPGFSSVIGLGACVA